MNDRATLLGSTIRIAAWPVLCLAAGCTPRGERADARIEVRELATPSGDESGEPNLAASPDGRVYLSWTDRVGEGVHALRLSARRAGEPWSAAVTIAQGTGWFVNWADFPSLAASPDGTLYAQWLAKSGSGAYAYDVQVARSLDGGVTWSEPVVPHRDGTPTEHGFASMTAWSPGAIGVAWLDGRRTAGAGHGEQAGAQAAMALVHTTIDREGRLGDETVLDERVCDCCQTDAVVADGATVLVYRDRSEKEVRDMSVVRHVGGRWSQPRTLAADGWEMNGCPVNGPAIAAAGRDVAVAWFTAASEKPLVKVAFSSDAGETFAEPLLVGDGRPLGRVDVVMLVDGSALVSWLEQDKPGARLLVRRVARGGPADAPATVADSSPARSTGFPRMLRAGGEVLIAWRDAGAPPRVRTAVLTIPSGR